MDFHQHQNKTGKYNMKFITLSSLTIGCSIAIALGLNVFVHSAQNSVDFLLYPLNAAVIFSFILALFPILTFFYLLSNKIKLRFTKRIEKQQIPKRIMDDGALHPIVREFFTQIRLLFLNCSLVSIISILVYFIAHPAALTRYKKIFLNL